VVAAGVGYHHVQAQLGADQVVVALRRGAVLEGRAIPRAYRAAVCEIGADRLLYLHLRVEVEVLHQRFPGTPREHDVAALDDHRAWEPPSRASLFDPLQPFAQCGRVHRSRPRVDVGGLLQQRLDLTRHIQHIEGVLQCPVAVFVVVRCERVNHGDREDREHRERVDVALSGEAPVVILRRGVGAGAVVTQGGFGRNSREDLRDPEVRDAWLPVTTQQNVFRLDIPVGDVVRVSEGQRV
jgi:hypothetical protein